MLAETLRRIMSELIPRDRRPDLAEAESATPRREGGERGAAA